MSRTRLSPVILWFACSTAALAFSTASLATTTADSDGPKSRAQVQAELDTAIHDGTFAHMRHNRSYPPQLDPSWRGSMPGRSAGMATNLRGSGEITYDAPAAGVRSREEVQRELQRAREDGSLQRMNTNRGF